MSFSLALASQSIFEVLAQPPLPELLPGDILLYRPSSFFGYLIAVKSWTWISHIEIFDGLGRSVASRDGIGVGNYPVRLNGLAYVRRATGPLDLNCARLWFRTVCGEKYDWKGILCFTLAVKQGAMDRMFCSEFATRWFRAAAFDMLSPDVDADHVAPSEFLQTPAARTIWSDGK